MLFIVCYIYVVSFRELCYELRKPQCCDPEYFVKFTVSKKKFGLYLTEAYTYKELFSPCDIFSQTHFKIYLLFSLA